MVYGEYRHVELWFDAREETVNAACTLCSWNHDFGTSARLDEVVSVSSDHLATHGDTESFR